MGNRWKKAELSRNGKEILSEEDWNKKETWIEIGVKYPDWDRTLNEKRIKIRERVKKTEKQNVEWGLNPTRHRYSGHLL